MRVEWQQELGFQWGEQDQKFNFAKNIKKSRGPYPIHTVTNSRYRLYLCVYIDMRTAEKKKGNKIAFHLSFHLLFHFGFSVLVQ